MNYYGFKYINHALKEFKISVRNPNKSPHWKYLGDNKWLDTSRNQEFLADVINPSKQKVQSMMFTNEASLIQMGYKKISNTI